MLSTNEHEKIILSDLIDMNSTFVVYKSSTNLYTIQNLKTQKFLKTDFFGNISFSGNYMGLYEQCYMNLENEISNEISNETNDNIIYDENKLTGICVLSKNYYKGGWLCNPTNNFLINSTSENLICTENI